jgi:hypothetical protein
MESSAKSASGANRPVSTTPEEESNIILSAKSVAEFTTEISRTDRVPPTCCILCSAPETEDTGQQVISTYSLAGTSAISKSVVRPRLCMAPALPHSKSDVPLSLMVAITYWPSLRTVSSDKTAQSKVPNLKDEDSVVVAANASATDIDFDAATTAGISPHATVARTSVSIFTLGSAHTVEVSKSICSMLLRFGMSPGEL